jgi:hypothetical protein
MRAAFLFILFIVSIATASDAASKKTRHVVGGGGDEFYSSARDDAALGPKINYPADKESVTSSSQRRFTGGQVNNGPFGSPGEALEVVPGLGVGR